MLKEIHGGEKREVLFSLILMTKWLILTESFPGRQPAGQTEIYYRENVIKNGNNRPFPSSPGRLYQNEVKCSAFDMEIKLIFTRKVVHLASF